MNPSPALAPGTWRAPDHHLLRNVSNVSSHPSQQGRGLGRRAGALPAAARRGDSSAPADHSHKSNANGASSAAGSATSSQPISRRWHPQISSDDPDSLVEQPLGLGHLAGIGSSGLRDAKSVLPEPPQAQDPEAGVGVDAWGGAYEEVDSATISRDYGDSDLEDSDLCDVEGPCRDGDLIEETSTESTASTTSATSTIADTGVESTGSLALTGTGKHVALQASVQGGRKAEETVLSSTEHQSQVAPEGQEADQSQGRDQSSFTQQPSFLHQSMSEVQENPNTLSVLHQEDSAVHQIPVAYQNPMTRALEMLQIQRQRLLSTVSAWGDLWVHQSRPHLNTDVLQPLNLTPAEPAPLETTTFRRETVTATDTVEGGSWGASAESRSFPEAPPGDTVPSRLGTVTRSSKSDVSSARLAGQGDVSAPRQTSLPALEVETVLEDPGGGGLDPADIENLEVLTVLEMTSAGRGGGQDHRRVNAPTGDVLERAEGIADGAQASVGDRSKSVSVEAAMVKSTVAAPAGPATVIRLEGTGPSYRTGVVYLRALLDKTARQVASVSAPSGPLRAQKSNGVPIMPLQNQLISVLFLLVPAAVCYALQLNIAKGLVVAGARSYLQLTAIGFGLKYIFELESIYPIFVAVSCMVLIAGHTASRRAKGVPNAMPVATCCILMSASIALSASVWLGVVPPKPRFVIPIAGIVVGSAMTIAANTMQRLADDMRTFKGQVEAALALGATPYQACGHMVKRAIEVGAGPSIDYTATIGLIQLPGTMTGMIMGGASVPEAIALQIVVTMVLLGSCTLCCILAGVLSSPQFFVGGTLRAYV